jgi:hypothetical protein
MCFDSIALANMRLAPIQICSPGHPVSTWGADIDYFVSGQDVEIREHPERNYSERLLLLPGNGCVNNVPQYERVGHEKACSELLINCPWYSYKLNYPFCKALKEIVDRSKRPLRLRIFVGASLLESASYIPFARELKTLLPDIPMDVITDLQYAEYMALMEEGDLSIDSYPYGGCNTIADSLFLRKPIVTWEGQRWCDRIGSQMLRQVGLSELAATSESEFVERALRLIGDDSYRSEIATRLERADLNATIFSAADAKYFRKGVEYVMEHHEELQSRPDRSPIVIPRH